MIPICLIAVGRRISGLASALTSLLPVTSTLTFSFSTLTLTSTYDV